MHATPFGLADLQRVALGVGVVGLIASIAMVYQFGVTMSVIHAVTLCAVTVLAAFIFPLRKFFSDLGAPKMATHGLMVAGLFFCALEFFSHLGYTVGMRSKSAQEATVQSAKFELTTDSVASEKESLAMWRSQLKDMKQENPWVTTVTTDGLKAQLANLEGDRIFARSKGCSNVTVPESRRFCDGLADVKDRLSKAAAMNDLATRIEATQKVVDTKTAQAIETKPGHSMVKAQTNFIPILWNLAAGSDADAALNPGKVDLAVTDIVIGFLIALGGTLLPTVAFYLAFWTPQQAKASPPAFNSAKPQIAAQTRDIHHHHKGPNVWADLRAALERYPDQRFAA